MKKISNLAEILAEIGSQSWNGITFVNEDEDSYISYKSLFGKANCLLAVLQERGVSKGDEVIILEENPQNFVVGFWTCILGGLLPVAFPIGSGLEQKIGIMKIWDLMDKPFLLTDKFTYDTISSFFTNRDRSYFNGKIGKRFFEFDDDSFEYVAKPNVKMQKISADDIALIQFSSGSTGEPKGSVITHANLIAEISAMSQKACVTGSDKFFSWQPLSHVMGLIGYHLLPLAGDIDQAIMGTELFVMNPLLWLQRAYEYGTTITSAPNFGLQHCIGFCKRYPKKAAAIKMDLSKIRIIANGSEPISLQVCKKFYDTMSPYGLREDCMYTVYGLSETTLAVTFPQIDEKVEALKIRRDTIGIGKIVEKAGEDEDGFDVVSVGAALACNEVRIADLNNSALGSEYIGRIQVKGANVQKCYYKNPEATKCAVTEDGWLDTGDLGFFKDSMLYVTGRLKDVIVVNGKNFYANDIEYALQDIKGAGIGSVAVTGLNSEFGSEEVLLFLACRGKNKQEVMKTASDIVNKVDKKFNIKVDKIVCVDEILKTPSGKVKRFQMKQDYIDGKYEGCGIPIQN